ncbi:MAG: hypothetical protein ABIZ91_14495 [Gemmatimonadaceae bacterium]
MKPGVWSEFRALEAARVVTRREFVSISGRTAAGLAMVACGGAGGSPVSPGATNGSASGVVLDTAGTAQPGFGTLILMYPSGRHVGLTAVPDSAGKFSFGNLPAGEYQLRFQAAGQAIIPEPYQHPLKFSVLAGRVTDVVVRIQRGSFNTNQVEIYCGDDFYQRQPDAPENGETVVKLGTIVCWYNVGLKLHTVTGGPWNDSGDLQKTQSYIWVASVEGLFPYRCKYNQPQMQATLRVVP